MEAVQPGRATHSIEFPPGLPATWPTNAGFNPFSQRYRSAARGPEPMPSSRPVDGSRARGAAVRVRALATLAADGGA